MKLPLYLLTLLLAGCALAGTTSTRLPYHAWYLGFQAPSNMEVWLETADVEDVRGQPFFGVMSGMVSLGYGGNPAGWGDRIPMGKGRDVLGAALPQRIYIRWQSLVEPQTYRAVLEIPQSARELMLRRVPSQGPPPAYEYPRAIAVALAPGGWVKAWVTSATSTPAEILCQKAEIEPKGPYRGLSGGKYRPLSERAAPYIKSHPIPYDSWKCPDAASSATP